jgi:hypothetical protein
MGATRELVSDRDTLALANEGFVLYRRLIPMPTVEALRALRDRWPEQHAQASTGGNLSLLDLDDPEVSSVVLCPTILAAVWAILKAPFQLDGVAFRDPRAGYGLQALHADFGDVPHREGSLAATSLLYLDPFGGDNGATRLVPGSHRHRGPFPKELRDPAARHPRELVLSGEPGDVVVFDGHLWHGGTRNSSGERRRALQMIFHARSEQPRRPPVAGWPDSLLERD